MTETYQREAQSMLLVLSVIHTSCNVRLQLSSAHQDPIGYDQHEPEISVANGLRKFSEDLHGTTFVKAYLKNTISSTILFHLDNCLI
jgi:hypothetical protein